MTLTISVVVIKVRAADLQPGDLYSFNGPIYWEATMNDNTIGQRAYIRTNTPLPPEKRNIPVYKLTVLVKDP